MFSWRHRLTTLRLTVISLVVVLAAGALAAPAVRAHGDEVHATPPPGGPVGVLLADHGEPPVYNADTYESFREFFGHLLDMGVMPSWLRLLETGTILYDADCPGCDQPSAEPRLVDAWLRPYSGPAVFVPATDQLAAHYVLPGGPGLGEPDIFEHVGLSAWREWQQMGGRSPNYDEKLVKKRAVVDLLRQRYGDRIAIRTGYGIDPRIGGARMGIREALDALVNRDRVRSLVVVYHGVGFSDLMQTHQLRQQVADHLATLGAGDLPVTYADPMGTSDHYVQAVVDKVRSELDRLRPDAAVAVHLSGHGLPTGMCGDYDCGADAYHAYAASLYRRVERALRAAIDRPGRTDYFQVYADGGEGDDDPADEVEGPLEALEARRAAGYTHVVDIPFEFDSNSRDTLIVLRRGYGRQAPDWRPDLRSTFTYDGMGVTISNASGGELHKIAALYEVAAAAIDDVLGPAAPSPSPSPSSAPPGEHHRTAPTAGAGLVP